MTTSVCLASEVRCILFFHVLLIPATLVQPEGVGSVGPAWRLAAPLMA